MTDDVIQPDAPVVPPIDMVIEFFSPIRLAGKRGIQRVDATTREVLCVLTDDGEDVSSLGMSYRGVDV